MEIQTHTVKRQTIEEFADEHGLVMEVRERGRRLAEDMGLRRYYASFIGVDENGNGVLIGGFGNGDTPDEAIADYAARISELPLVVDAWKDSRREIRAPILRHEPKGDDDE